MQSSFELRLLAEGDFLASDQQRILFFAPLAAPATHEHNSAKVARYDAVPLADIV
jgi:hypothetical protein